MILNKQIEYALSQSTVDSPAARMFAVDSLTGDVIVVGRVDRELSDTYRLLIVARNRPHGSSLSPGSVEHLTSGGLTNLGLTEGTSSVSDESDAIVVIHVDDVNDNAPSISVNTLLTTTAGASVDGVAASVALVPEEQDQGTFVAHVRVTDPDDGRNGRFECRLVQLDDSGGGSGTAFRLKEVGNGEFQVVTDARLDREVVESYRLELTCRDGGIPMMSSTARLHVQVKDHPPKDMQFILQVR